MTVMYSLLHLLVDGICALAMFGTFLSSENVYYNILLYNFCAFALQMPFGVLLDILNTKIKNAQRKLSFFTAVLGIFFTIAGALTHPVVLGIGNALFHIGGGVAVICEGQMKNDRGRRLGVFVAPGALGLFLGTLAAKNGAQQEIFYVMIALVLFICGAMICVHKNLPQYLPEKYQQEIRGVQCLTGSIWASGCCLMVVLFRSYIGMAVTFPWKTGVLPTLAAVAAIVCGKMAGGFCAARYGCIKTAAVSLCLAAVCFFFSFSMPMGMAALFLFNMTMPVTLYLMICRLPQMPGFSFGFLTFALFLGFLPGYFGHVSAAAGNRTGCLGSLISLCFLLAGIYMGGEHGRLSD